MNLQRRLSFPPPLSLLPPRFTPTTRLVTIIILTRIITTLIITITTIIISKMWTTLTVHRPLLMEEALTVEEVIEKVGRWTLTVTTTTTIKVDLTTTTTTAAVQNLTTLSFFPMETETTMATAITGAHHSTQIWRPSFSNPTTTTRETLLRLLLHLTFQQVPQLKPPLHHNLIVISKRFQALQSSQTTESRQR